jgi:hypothetical protein
MAGFVYIMSNPAFPDLIKIGKSKKDPTTDRVNELNQTGVPEPFKVEYYAFVSDENLLEKLIHENFKSSRPNKNRDFFSVSLLKARYTIRELANERDMMKFEESFIVDENYESENKTIRLLLRSELRTAFLKFEAWLFDKPFKLAVGILLIFLLSVWLI